MLKQQHKIFSLFLLLCSCLLHAQTNLVPNGSFETYTMCPDGGGVINYATPWYSPTTGTTDYYNSCYDSIGLGVLRVELIFKTM